MRVFISWSGNRSRLLAESLRHWLPGVIQAVRPYFTPDDLTKGARWNSEVSRELEACRVGILCLTADNLQAPWLLFEAGALSKNLDNSRVCPILFGLEPTDLEGPLVQFQAARFSKEEIRRVVEMINSELADAALSTGVLDSVFEMWWPELERKVQEYLALPMHPGGADLRSERDLLEEVLSLTRSLSQISQTSSPNPFVTEDLLEQYFLLVQELKEGDLSETIALRMIQIQKPLRHFIRKLPDIRKAEYFSHKLSATRDSLSGQLSLIVKGGLDSDEPSS